MARMVDLDDITDTAGVAELLGLGRPVYVRQYKQRYDDFPEPVLNLGAGRCLLWLRSDVEAWNQRRRERREPAGG